MIGMMVSAAVVPHEVERALDQVFKVKGVVGCDALVRQFIDRRRLN